MSSKSQLPSTRSHHESDGKLLEMRERLVKKHPRDTSGLPLVRVESEMGWFLDTDVVNLIHHNLPSQEVRATFLSCRYLDACPIADRNPRATHSLLVVMSETHSDGVTRTLDSTVLPINDDLKPKLKRLGLDLDHITFLLVPRARFEELCELSEIGEKGVRVRRDRLRELDPDADARSVFPRIVHRAAELGASDIHISPRRDRYSVRMRRKSVLEQVYILPPKTGAALVNIIKTCAGLDITERRVPQDGRITLAQQKYDLIPAEFMERLKDVSLRVSTIPTVIREHGEKLVVRLLRSGSTENYQLDNLGFPPPALADLRRIMLSPHGMLVVTGPTGSGKTTTLYSVLAELNDGTMNISTAEDPVETRFDDMDQCQVNENISLRFARLLRAFLRQDPDCILVGEIRDPETADSAVQAARTGHLLLSTLHTLDSFTAFPRLKELGIGAPTLASCLSAVLAQRLVRELCPSCSVRYDAREELSELLGSGIAFENLVSLRRPPAQRSGFCQQCQNSGYTSQIPVIEIWVPSDAERHAMIYDPNVTHESLALLATARGMQRMSMLALELVLSGRTSLAEMLRAVTSADEFRKEPLVSAVKRLVHKDGNTGS